MKNIKLTIGLILGIILFQVGYAQKETQNSNPKIIITNNEDKNLGNKNNPKEDIINFYGELNTGAVILPITLKIETKTDTTIILMGSPSQTEELFNITKQRFTEDSILFTIKSLGVVYRGRYNSTKDSIEGSFKQGGMIFPLIFTKRDKAFTINRPQEPKPPYPYIEEELGFSVKGVNYQFKGTLTLPSTQGEYPCVILLTGSGTQNRDEEVFNHKPFKVIADYLTRNGIAVFRYDDRGYKGNIMDSSIFNATTFDFVVDAEAAFKLLSNHKNINKNKIGVLGHSEGGLIASILASKNKDINFVILLAAPGQKGIDILLSQNEKIFNHYKMPNYALDIQLSALKESYKLIEKDFSNKDILNRMDNWFDKKLKKLPLEERKSVEYSSPAARRTFINSLTSNWMRTFLQTDPTQYLKNIKQPTLVLNGTKDCQVICELNIPIIEKALKKSNNTNYKIVKAEELNHLFQECKTGMTDEYGSIEQTISESILKEIRNFIKETTK